MGKTKNPSQCQAVTAAPEQARRARLAHAFPTRQFPYRELAREEGVALDQPPEFTLPPGTICRFIFGRDEVPRVMTAEESAEHLNDPFATLLLRRGVLPMTMRSLTAELDRFKRRPEGLPQQASFLVADGGQIPWSPETTALNRAFRIVVVRHRGGDSELLVSTGTDFDSESIFLQVFAWDPRNAAYNFYERRSGAWCWAGSSWDALEPDSRGNGPFDSHVNGGPVMKELKTPWMHWHSQAATINADVLAPNDPLRDEPLYRDRAGAEKLETFIRAGIARWNKARFEKRIVDGQLTRAQEFLRQVLVTTTLNITSSAQESRVLQSGDLLRLPRTFFLNTDALLSVLRLPITFRAPTVDAQHYLDLLGRYDVKIRDQNFQFAGDTHFAFAVPEPAFEDLVVLQELLARGILSRKAAVALLMVDFPNPVFSSRRDKLLVHVPDEFPTTEGAFETAFVPMVRRAAETATPDAPEREFLAVWDLLDADWEQAVVERLQDYLANVDRQLAAAEGFDAFFRLAESRRREFRRRPLAEFRLTTATTNIPEDAPFLEMSADARVRPRS
jgi:hypothetical protein